MSFLILAQLFLHLIACASCSAAVLPATSQQIRWTGRAVANADGSAVSFDWGSIQALFTVTGASAVWATLNSTFWEEAPVDVGERGSAVRNFMTSGGRAARGLQQKEFPKLGVYRVYVNGLRVQDVGFDGIVALPGEGEHMLVSGLNPQRAYNVSLWYTSDPVYNSWPDLDAGAGCKQSVVSLRTDGQFAAPPPQRVHSMLIIGDSITSGNAMYTPCTSDNATRCDSSQSYAGRICEAFALNCTVLTASSKGLTRNCCDALNATVPVLANRTFAQNASSLWDWSISTYDAALIHLGTNDGNVNAQLFTSTYVALLRHVDSHARQHGIPIFCAYGPNSATFAPWVQAAIDEVTALGIRAQLLNFMAAPMDGCGHPGVNGHAAMAHSAAPIIANSTGWPYVTSLLG